MTSDHYRIATSDVTNSTATDGQTSPTSYSDIDSPTEYSNFTDTIAKYKNIQDIIDDIYYEILNNPKLLYKGWLTEKEWIRELYLASVYKKLKAYIGHHQTVFRLRTVKGTSPIRRNRPGGRK